MVGDCGRQLCLANSEDPDARFVREAFGLRQLTDDDEESSWLSLSDGLFAFSAARISPQIEGHAVYAYNLKTNEFDEVAAGLNNHSYLPTADGRRVVYSLRNATAAGPRIWDSETGQTVPIEPVLGGDVKAVGFDYPWVALNGGYSGNNSEDGYWVYNVEDQRRVFLYKPYPRTQLPDKSYETIIGADVINGAAVYVLTRATPENQPPKRYNLTVYAVNLDTGERREYYNSDHGAYRFSYSGRYVALESNLEAWSLDMDTGEFRKHSYPGEQCGFPSSGGGWVAFRCVEIGKGWDSSKVFLAKPATGERIQLQGNDMDFSQIVTDGQSVVVKAGRNQNLTEPFHLDLFWAPISELKGT